MVRTPTLEPEELAALTPERVGELAPEQVKGLGPAHYEAMSSAQIEALFPVVKIGPTWQTDDEGNWLLPEHTLGWEIAGWIAEWLHGPDGSENFTLTLEQLRFVLWWYAVDEQGSFTYRTGVLQRLKGWGKDPLLAALCLVELVGPSRFGGWRPDGTPIAEPHPAAWVQVAAVSRDQTRNTMTMFPVIMSDRFKAKYDVEVGIELIRARRGRARLEAVTSNPRSLEGGRSTFVVLNETHHWLASNKGHHMYETVDGNTTKVKSRYLAITNAYLPGEDSVAERMRESYEKVAEGKAADFRFLYDSLEAHSLTPLNFHVLPTILKLVRGDSVWLDIDEILSSIANTTIAPSRSRRMWLNQVVAEEDALYGPAQWDALHDEGIQLGAGDEIVLGFDGGKTDDSTALVALRVSDRAAFLLELWEKPDGPQGDGWEINREEVNSAVHEAFSLYEVKGFYADVALWESYIAEWEQTYGEGLSVKASERGAIGWDMRRSLKVVTLAHERLMRSIFDGKLRHDGNRSLRRHVLNARRRNNNHGISFGKESRDSARKVDAYAALLLAFECLTDLHSRGKKTKKKTGRSYWL